MAHASNDFVVIFQQTMQLSLTSTELEAIIALSFRSNKAVRQLG